MTRKKIDRPLSRATILVTDNGYIVENGDYGQAQQAWSFETLSSLCNKLPEILHEPFETQPETISPGGE